MSASNANATELFTVISKIGLNFNILCPSVCVREEVDEDGPSNAKLLLDGAQNYRSH